MVKNGDFIELDFTAKVKESGSVFDTTLQDIAKKEGLPLDKEKLKPIKICIGKGMVIKGFDLALENKDVGKEHHADINPENAFGKRNHLLIRTIPEKIFLEKEVQPVKGMVLNMDNTLVRIISVSGGRVMVDFNNPLAGKVVTYSFKINRIIEDTKEKLSILVENYLDKKSEIKLEDKKASITVNPRFLSNKKAAENFVKMVKELLGVDVTLEKKEEKKEVKGVAKGNEDIKEKVKSEEHSTKSHEQLSKEAEKSPLAHNHEEKGHNH